jgi:hypothetical protein
MTSFIFSVVLVVSVTVRDGLGDANRVAATAVPTTVAPAANDPAAFRKSRREPAFFASDNFHQLLMIHLDI